jgi:hypothetical protein
MTTGAAVLMRLPSCMHSQAARQQRALASAAQQLRAGADSLRLAAGRDERFYSDLTRLQRCWKVWGVGAAAVVLRGLLLCRRIALPALC